MSRCSWGHLLFLRLADACTFLFSGQVCGATLVHAKFILTELECATKVMTKATGKYVVVLIGQERRTRVGLSPWAQVYSGV